MSNEKLHSYSVAGCLAAVSRRNPTASVAVRKCRQSSGSLAVVAIININELSTQKSHW